jgi:hypothetical protein
MTISYRNGAAPMTIASSGQNSAPQQTTEPRNARAACAADEQAECPRCAGSMRLWAGFYRCPNCGFKESCCF